MTTTIAPLTPSALGLPDDAVVTESGDYYRTDWNARQYTIESASTGERYNVIVQLEVCPEVSVCPACGNCHTGDVCGVAADCTCCALP